MCELGTSQRWGPSLRSCDSASPQHALLSACRLSDATIHEDRLRSVLSLLLLSYCRAGGRALGKYVPTGNVT